MTARLTNKRLRELLDKAGVRNTRGVVKRWGVRGKTDLYIYSLGKWDGKAVAIVFRVTDAPFPGRTRLWAKSPFDPSRIPKSVHVAMMSWAKRAIAKP